MEVRGATIWFDARTDTADAACPTCGTTSNRVHSRYVRHLSDRSVGGREVCIRLQVGRFRCPDRQCAARRPHLRHGRRLAARASGG
ncbi:transposase family protein [Nocardia sp. GAS34]